MKNPMYLLAIATLMFFSAMMTSCQSSADKVEEAQEDVQDAKEDLSDVRQEAAADAQKAASAEEWQMFRSEHDIIVKNNDTRISELKAKMKKTNSAADKAYAERIDALEQRNKELRNRIDGYEANQSDWESFKREFKHDMEAIGQGFKDLGVNNKG